MTTEIIKFDVQNEMDIVLAHRRAMQFARFAGISLSEQTRFATAVSEICRNCLEYAQSGTISFSVIKENDSFKLSADITDKGPGIKNLDQVLTRDPQSHRGRGIGIVFARKLADQFRITSTAKGTNVLVEKLIPAKQPLNNLIIQGWAQHIRNEPAISAYEELKYRNDQLLQLTEELRNEKLLAESHNREIQLLNNKLEENNENMKNFTYTVSHDLRTPLTSLRLALSFLDEMNVPEEISEYLKIINRASGRLENTVQGLVKILLMQTNTDNSRKLSLEEIFTEVYEDFAGTISEIGASITFDFTAVPGINYIEAYLKSIFTNLISNAIKYRSADRKLSVSVQARRSDNKVVLTFRDNGQGIDMERHGDKLFAPFIRFSENTEGNGIGLYIIRNMVRRNGGSIDVDSEPGRGTTFSFFLPEYPPAG